MVGLQVDDPLVGVARAESGMRQNVRVEQDGEVVVVTIDRPDVRNAVDRPTADQLAEAFRAFDADASAKVAVLTGAGGTFCAGADLRAVASGDMKQMNRLEAKGDGPMGPSRMRLSKPVIAAVEGWAVAGGLELACWADLRVAAETAIFGVFCRRWGVPLIDGGTVRLPRLIGHSRAMDMILTGRPVVAEEAHDWGLANRLAKHGQALDDAVALAKQLAAFPQTCMREDRASAIAQWSLSEADALALEFQHGLMSLSSPELVEGAKRFAAGSGRHGSFEG